MDREKTVKNKTLLKKMTWARFILSIELDTVMYYYGQVTFSLITKNGLFQ